MYNQYRSLALLNNSTANVNICAADVPLYDPNWGSYVNIYISVYGHIPAMTVFAVGF